MTRMDTLCRGGLLAACLMLAHAAGSASTAVADALATSSVTLNWTATGDDGFAGAASSYDLRYSTSPITSQSFPQATPVPGVPAPALAGTRQQVKVTGLEAGTLYYFALKASDDAGNSSGLANVTYTTPVTPTRPTTILPISLSPPYPTPTRHYVRLDMTLPRDMTVHVKVIDLSGRLVKTLAEGLYPGGVTLLEWGTADETGARLRAGQYWVLGLIGASTFSHRLVLVP